VITLTQIAVAFLRIRQAIERVLRALFRADVPQHPPTPQIAFKRQIPENTEKTVMQVVDSTGSILSPEGRLRAFASDLLAIVDSRDADVLEKAKALADIPAKRPKPAPTHQPSPRSSAWTPCHAADALTASRRAREVVGVPREHA
jgi:hypothetical protein